MKKAPLFIVAGAALFAAGYFTRSTTHPAAEPKKDNSPLVAAITGISGDGTKAAGKPGGDQSVRKFTPGRPFPRGGAKAWLMSLAGLDFDDESRLPELMEIAQAVMTMDADCAKEMAEAMMDIAQLIENEDPAMQAIPNADELIEGGLMLAVIRLSQINPEAALDMMKKYPNAMDDMAMMFVFGKVASQNPQHAEELAMGMPDDGRGDALQAVVKSLGAKDPRAALALAQKHAELVGPTYVNEVLQNWAKRDPQQAMPEAVRIAGESGDPNGIRSVFGEWMKKDEKAAQAWANAHEGPGKTTVQAMMLEERASEDVSSVLGDYAKLQQSVKDQKELQRLTSLIANKMAEDDVDATKTWVAGLPAGSAKDAAISELAQQWVEEDAEAASAWIKELPPGSGRDGAAVQLSDKIMRRDPAAALEWVRSIQDESLRNDRFRRVIGVWEEQDPAAAKAAKASLPPNIFPDEFDPPQHPGR